MVAQKLHDGQQVNQHCLKLQDETVGMRIDQNQKITDAMATSINELREFEAANTEKEQSRTKLANLLKYQREIEIALSKDQLAYDNLKSV